jgi:D-sedoheptulose 7-phosphate isomerase
MEPIHCSTCRDEAVAGVVIAIASADRTASVQLATGPEAVTVALDLVEDVAVGDNVLVHQGFAIQRLERDYGRELYPFLYQDAGTPTDDQVAGVLAQVRDSTLQKCQDVVDLRRRILGEYADDIVAASAAMAAALGRGRKLIAFGNGGSATDADDAVADCLTPPYAEWRAFPAISLSDDVGVVTAVANDVGFEHVFSRQIIAFGEAGDIALGFSTSGNSPSVVAAFAEAHRRGLVTIGLAGGEGGAMSLSGDVHHCFVARSDQIPRIQEGHATVWHSLLELIQAQLR